MPLKKFAAESLIPAAQTLMLLITVLQRMHTPESKRNGFVRKTCQLSNNGFRALHLLATQAQLTSQNPGWPLEERVLECATEGVDVLIGEWVRLFHTIESHASEQSMPQGLLAFIFNGGRHFKYRAYRANLPALPDALEACLERTNAIIETQILPTVRGYRFLGHGPWIECALKQVRPIGGSINGWLTLARNLPWDITLTRLNHGTLPEVRRRRLFGSHPGEKAAPGLLETHFSNPTSVKAATPAALLPKGVSVSSTSVGMLVVTATYESSLAKALFSGKAPRSPEDADFLKKNGIAAEVLGTPRKLEVICEYPALSEALEKAQTWLGLAAVEEAPLLEKYQAHRSAALRSAVEQKLKATFTAEEIEAVRALLSEAN